MSGPPRWPKGPFPEKYRGRAVHDRLASAWSRLDSVAALDRVRELGLVAHPRHSDPLVKLFVGVMSDELTALAGVTAIAWLPSTRDDVVRADDGPMVVLLPSADPIEALVLVGIGGPQYGIGNAAIARFLTTLRSFARYRIEAIGEERIELSITPRDESAARLIADRMRHVCPPLMRTSIEALTIELAAGRFVLDFR
jgi:hypothetical protein